VSGADRRVWRKGDAMKVRVWALVAALMLAVVPAHSVAGGSPPSNDLRSHATPLIVDAPVDYDGTNATISPSDPNTCVGSHGSFPGPYFGSVWFSYRAINIDKWIFLSSPTVQGKAHDYLGITFIYQRTGHGLELVDCTAFGNDAKWQPRAAAEYLIMEAGLSSAVTDYPPLSDRGGHGSLYLFRSKTLDEHYHYIDAFTYNDCGPTVNGSFESVGTFYLRKQGNGRPPFLSDDYEFHTISTNPANGKWFREDGYDVYEDIQITRVKGTIFQFVSRHKGRPYVLTDMHGNRLFADFGTIVVTFQVDTKGDDDLNNDEFIDGSFSVVRERGNHDAFFFDGDFCDIVRDLLGDPGSPGSTTGPHSRADLAPLFHVNSVRPPY
jgi:hypothetical protein